MVGLWFSKLLLLAWEGASGFRIKGLGFRPLFLPFVGRIPLVDPVSAH